MRSRREAHRTKHQICPQDRRRQSIDRGALPILPDIIEDEEAALRRRVGLNIDQRIVVAQDFRHARRAAARSAAGPRRGD